MKKIVLSLFLLTAIFDAWSCSCVHQPMSVKKIIESDLVVLGKIMQRDIIKDVVDENENAVYEHFKMEHFMYTVAVLEVIHGKIIRNRVEIYSATQGAACGVHYDIGEVIYLFTYKWKGKQFTGLCSQNIRQESLTRKQKKVFRKYQKGRKYKNWRDENRQKMASGKARNKIPEGEWIFYHADGSIAETGVFKDGKKHGEWKHYFNIERSNSIIENNTNWIEPVIKNGENVLNRITTFNAGERIDMKNVLQAH